MDRLAHRSPSGSVTAPRRGFTLIELLVVVSIIALLIAILLPSLSRARQQTKGVVCLSRCRQLGLGMTMYFNDSDNYPAHQWRLGPPGDTRIRWFNAMASYVGGYTVQSCPATPDWEVGRNNSYGYNYKYLGSVRDNNHADNRSAPFERYPVRHIRMPELTIAFADCDGTGWTMPYGPDRPVGDNNPLRLGNHGYLLDPTYIPTYSVATYSGGDLEPYAWHNWRSYLSNRHMGKSEAIFVDGHGESVDPKKAYEDNKLWNGLGHDPGQDDEDPLYQLDRHVTYKYDAGSGQEWRYP